jgi:ArsR family transcriptional regulator, arsenate/arsenite/antimonite-responsive transcriptional repressor
MNNLAAVKAFSALGQESRLNIFRLIVQRSNLGVTPSEIVEQLGIPATTTSFHLKELSNADLIQVSKSGRSLTYKINPDSVSSLVEFLTENCCGGTPCGLEQPRTKKKVRQKADC